MLTANSRRLGTADGFAIQPVPVPVICGRSARSAHFVSTRVCPRLSCSRPAHADHCHFRRRPACWNRLPQRRHRAGRRRPSCTPLLQTRFHFWWALPQETAACCLFTAGFAAFPTGAGRGRPTGGGWDGCDAAPARDAAEHSGRCGGAALQCNLLTQCWPPCRVAHNCQVCSPR